METYLKKLEKGLTPSGKQFLRNLAGVVSGDLYRKLESQDWLALEGFHELFEYLFYNFLETNNPEDGRKVSTAEEKDFIYNFIAMNLNMYLREVVDGNYESAESLKRFLTEDSIYSLGLHDTGSFEYFFRFTQGGRTEKYQGLSPGELVEKVFNEIDRTDVFFSSRRLRHSFYALFTAYAIVSKRETTWREIKSWIEEAVDHIRQKVDHQTFLIRPQTSAHYRSYRLFVLQVPPDVDMYEFLNRAGVPASSSMHLRSNRRVFVERLGDDEESLYYLLELHKHMRNRSSENIYLLDFRTLHDYCLQSSVLKRADSHAFELLCILAVVIEKLRESGWTDIERIKDTVFSAFDSHMGKFPIEKPDTETLTQSVLQEVAAETLIRTL